MRNTCAGVGTLVVHARHAMRAQHHPHLLQHVAIVVDAGFVEADRGVDALRLERVQRRDAGAQAEIGRAVVADAGAGRGERGRCPPRSARRRGRASCCGPSRPKRSMYSTAVQPPRRRAYSFWYAVSTRCMCIGTLYLREVSASRVSAASEHQCRLAGASWIFDPALVVMPAVQFLEQRDVVVQRQLEPREPALHRAAQFRRQAGDEVLVAPDRPAGSGRAPRRNRRPACRYPRRRGSPRRHRASTSASLPGTQPWMCCTVVMPEAIISNAEYSVSRYRFRLRATMRVTNHSSSGMSGEPSCTGVSPTWWWPLMKPGSRISLPRADHRDVRMLSATGRRRCRRRRSCRPPAAPRRRRSRSNCGDRARA